MSDRALQPIAPGEISRDTTLRKALLARNNAHAQELSWLEPERLQHLVEQAFLARRIGDLDAFLLAFDQDARYDSPNFPWFCARYPSFVTAEAGHERVVCEVNTSPPNPASDAFHAAVGFVEVGKASIYDGSRAVRYLSHAL